MQNTRDAIDSLPCHWSMSVSQSLSVVKRGCFLVGMEEGKEETILCKETVQGGRVHMFSFFLSLLQPPPANSCLLPSSLLHHPIIVVAIAMEVSTSALQKRQQVKEYPLLWWTEWFHSTIEEGKVVDYCGLPYTCRFTLDRAKFNESKVVIFHASRFEYSLDDYPNLLDVRAGKKALILNTRM